MNRTLMERDRSMISGVGLEKMFWVEVVSIACYLINISPTLVPINKTPVEVWKRKNPSHQHLHVFCCEAYAHVPKEK
jgi:hypothetical protein